MRARISTPLRWLALGVIAAVFLVAALLMPAESIAVTLDPGTLPPDVDAAYELESVGSRLMRIGLVVLSALTLLYVFGDVARRTR